jgi:predicted transglutaminase-like cysteine proteinase
MSALMSFLTSARGAELTDVNRAVNDDVRYVSDAAAYGRADYWEPAEGAGDCEDYALAKCRRLVALGWSRDSLRIACCWTEANEYHAVLTVDTDLGTFVLDNRRDEIRPWAGCGYRWDKREVPGRGLWERIGA